eukprot:7481953-Pyramimonas_sp.AAC.1
MHGLAVAGWAAKAFQGWVINRHGGLDQRDIVGGERREEAINARLRGVRCTAAGGRRGGALGGQAEKLLPKRRLILISLIR